MTHLSNEQLEQAVNGEALPHLHDCAECQAAVRRAMGLKRMLSGMRPYTLSDAAFARSEARVLERMRETPARAISWLWRALPIAAALALAAGLIWWRQQAPVVAEPVVAVRVESAPPAVAAAYEPLTVVALQGAAPPQFRANAEGELVPLKLGQTLLAQARVQADGPAARVIGVSANERVRAELHGAAALGLTDVSIDLGEAASVRLDLVLTQRWLVRAGDEWFASSDAEFSVTRVSPDVAVLEVSRGVVEHGQWASRGKGHVEQAARGRWRIAPSGAAVDGTGEVQAAPLAPVWRDGIWFSLGAVPGAIELDGQRYGGAPLQMLLPPGRHTLRAVGDNGSVTTREFSIAPGEPLTMNRLDPVARPPVEATEVDPAALRAWVNEQRAKLSPCYEKWLKGNAEARGEATLTISVSPTGRVVGSRVEPRGVVPQVVAECLSATVKKWRPPVRDADIEIPLVFSKSR